jgi:hypothetical protein
MMVRKKTWKVEHSITSISREVMLGRRWRAFRVVLKGVLEDEAESYFSKLREMDICFTLTDTKGSTTRPRRRSVVVE